MSATTLTTELEIAHLALALIGSDQTITSLSADEAKEDRIINRFFNQVRDEVLELYPWKHAIEHRVLVLESGYYEFEEVYDTDPIDITGITAANPAVVTAAAHGFLTGDHVHIYDVVGMTEVNRDEPYHVTKVLDTTFQLTGINSTNWTAYTSGGKARKLEPLEKYQDGYVYNLPSDLAYPIMLQNNEDFEIRNAKLLCNVEDAVLIYIKSGVTGDANVSKLTSLFINAWAHRLAMRICTPILGPSETLKAMLKALRDGYLLALNEAMLAAARSEKRTRNTMTPWLNGYTGG